MSEPRHRDRDLLHRALSGGAECLSLQQLEAVASSTSLDPGIMAHLKACPRCQVELSMLKEFEEAKPLPDEGAAAAWVAAQLGKAHPGRPPAPAADRRPPLRQSYGRSGDIRPPGQGGSSSRGRAAGGRRPGPATEAAGMAAEKEKTGETIAQLRVRLKRKRPRDARVRPARASRGDAAHRAPPARAPPWDRLPATGRRPPVRSAVRARQSLEELSRRRFSPATPCPTPSSSSSSGH